MRAETAKVKTMARAEAVSFREETVQVVVQAVTARAEVGWRRRGRGRKRRG